MEILAVLASISFACMLVSFWNLRKTRKATEEVRKLDKEFTAFRKFYEWGRGTRMVTRNKVSHENVADTSVFDLYTKWAKGEFFRGSTMLYEHTDFKVYVATPFKPDGE